MSLQAIGETMKPMAIVTLELVPKNPGAFSPGPTAWESNPKRQGGMRTRCPTNPSGDLAPTQGGDGSSECVVKLVRKLGAKIVRDQTVISRLAQRKSH